MAHLAICVIIPINNPKTLSSDCSSFDHASCQLVMSGIEVSSAITTRKLESPRDPNTYIGP